MKQVVQVLRTGEVSVREVPIPLPGPHSVLVRNAFSLISAGTERSKVDLGRSSLLEKARKRPDDVRRVMAKIRRDGLLDTYRMVTERLEQPSLLGYSCAGHAVQVGELVEGIQPGDRVACAGAGYANHAEYVAVPGNLCVRVPQQAALEQAAFGTVGAIAIQGFRLASVGLGDRVGVIGLGLVGQILVQVAAAAGCRVYGVDIDLGKCDGALGRGAAAAVALDSDPAAVFAAETHGLGLDAVIITAATTSSDPIVLAGELCRDKGTVVVVGDVGMNVPRPEYYHKELTLRLSRSYGPGRYDPVYEEDGIDYPYGYVRWTERRNIEEFLRLVDTADVSVETLITHRFAVADAPLAYDVITGRAEEPFFGVLLSFEDGRAAETARTRIQHREGRALPRADDSVGVSMIGVGNFGTSVLIPALKGTPGVSLVSVASASGVTAGDAGARHGFARTAASPAEIAVDTDVEAVVIATPHDSHAELASAFLRAGKSVFVEKPLALSIAQLEDVVEAYNAGDGHLTVGFNRRFAPLTQRLKGLLSASPAPPTVIVRVNAGALPANHWTQDIERGGGRIVGEMCHFIDLAGYLAGARVTSVFAQGLGNHKPAALQDTVVATFGYENGALATVTYTAEGDAGYPKERIEVYQSGAVAEIDDFRRLLWTKGGKREVVRLKHADKGHSAEIRAFVAEVRGERSGILDAAASVDSTRATLAVVESLTTGSVVRFAAPGRL